MKPNSRLVNNRTSSPTYSRLTLNLLPSGIRKEQLEGREHIVVPMVILTEGVHNGSQGPLLYGKEELGKTPVSWNHKPVVVYHPTLNGEGISACQPHILNSRKIGTVLNTHFENGKLKSEAWIEKPLADKVDPRIMESINNNQMMELSTGVYIDVEDVEGKWNDTEPYVGIARNFRPDHLALLPDQEGACSIKDGAGFIRNQKGEDKSFKELLKEGLESLGVFVGNEMSDATKNRMLATELTKRHYPTNSGKYGPAVFPKSVYANFVVYQHPEDNKLLKLGYKATKNSVKLNEGQPEEVDQVTEYRTKKGDFVGNISKGKNYGGFLVKGTDGNEHLPTMENGKMSRSLCGAAYAALTSTHRGQSYQGPNKGGALSKLRAIYKQNGWDLPTGNSKPHMDKNEKIALVINAKAGWDEKDRDTLEAMSDTQLEFIHNSIQQSADSEDEEVDEDEEAATQNQAMSGTPAKKAKKGKKGVAVDTVKTGKDANDPDAAEEDTEEADAPAKNSENPVTLESYISAAPTEVREILQNSMAVMNEEKATLVKVILQNKNNGFAKADLVNKPLAELRNLARLAAPATVRRSANYEGLAPVENSANEETPLEMPVINYGKPEGKMVTA